MERFFQQVQNSTETFLTWRAVRKQQEREKRRRKHLVLDWLESFLWAAAVVLLVNQYLLQAYQIPSKSMTDTLMVDDRIFVDKVVYGPELMPGMMKLSGFDTPARGSVVIFENPAYTAKGPLFDVFQRVLYMLSLSLIDIDRDEHGQSRPHFLIKRTVGLGSDRLRLRNGEFEILAPGERAWMPEREFFELSGLHSSVRRVIRSDQYEAIRTGAVADAYRYAGLTLPAGMESGAVAVPAIEYPDLFTEHYQRMKTLHAIHPQDEGIRSLWMREHLGWYVPVDRIFPLGDNRDNSRDARFFGAVPLHDVLGRATFKYWPIHRVGIIR